MNPARILERLVVAVAFCTTVLLALDTARRVVLPLSMDRCRPRRFDQDRWRDSTLTRAPAAVRGCMVDDLLRRELLPGRTRDEVIALLGEPPRTHYFGEYDLVYWLGPERGLISVDSEWIVLRLRSDGRVSEARIVTD